MDIGVKYALDNGKIKYRIKTVYDNGKAGRK